MPDLRFLYRCERLEEQLNDLTELHQNEILNLKQELASMEEKIAYQSYERARDIQVCLVICHIMHHIIIFCLFLIVYFNTIVIKKIYTQKHKQINK